MYITYYVLLLDVFVVVTDGTSGCIRCLNIQYLFSVLFFFFFLVFVIICLFATSSGELKIFKNQQKSWTWSSRGCVPHFAVVQRGI